MVKQHISLFRKKSLSEGSLMLSSRRTGGVRTASKGKTTLDSPRYSRNPKMSLGRLIWRSKIALGRLLGAENSLLGGSWAFKRSKRTPENFVFRSGGEKVGPKGLKSLKTLGKNTYLTISAKVAFFTKKEARGRRPPFSWSPGAPQKGDKSPYKRDIRMKTSCI